MTAAVLAIDRNVSCAPVLTGLNGTQHRIGAQVGALGGAVLTGWQ